MIPSQNISHFEFLGPYVVISKVEIRPIFVVLKKKSKIACFRLKNSFLSFWKKYCLYQSHFFTQLSGIPARFFEFLKLGLYTKKQSWPPRADFESIEFLAGIVQPKSQFCNGISKIGPNPVLPLKVPDLYEVLFFWYWG